jgi:uncharacterized phage-associated protein
MQYPALAIANEFIELALKSDGSDLTPLKLQKLVYYAHGWHLALTGQPLIDERIQAWQYGPVTPSLYRDLREYGNQKVDHVVSRLESYSDSEEVSFGHFVRVTPRIKLDGSEEAVFAKNLVNRIWEVYGKYTPARLSNATHAEGSPWRQVYKEGCKSLAISDDIIAKYFKDLQQVPAKA